MEIDPQNLPSEVNVLQQIVLQLLQTAEDKDQLWRAYNIIWRRGTDLGADPLQAMYPNL